MLICSISSENTDEEFAIHSKSDIIKQMKLSRNSLNDFFLDIKQA